MAEVDRLLREFFGEPKRPRDSDPLELLIRTILSQNTSDRNRDLAYENLRARFPTWEDLLNAEEEEVAEAIRPAGLYRERARTIRAVLERIKRERGEFTLDFLRELSPKDAEEWLLSLPGVGKKTAYVVLLFGFGFEKFPVDTHIRRVTQRLGFWDGKGDPHEALAGLIPKGRAYALHLNLIALGRRVCRPRNPRCTSCPLLRLCPYGKKKEEK
jgi:endonuclease-3